MSVIPGMGAAGDQLGKAMAALDKTQAPATPEVVPAPEVKPPVDDQASRAFQVLAKKEKQMFLRQREIKEREARMLEREAIIKRHEELEARGKQDPMVVLEALGWNYDKLTQHQLNGGQMTPEMIAQQAMKRVEELEQRQRDEQTKRDEDALATTKAQQEEVKQGFKEEIVDFISANSDEYEWIQHFGAEELVYDTIQLNFEKNKKIMPIDMAAKHVEKFLEDEEVERLTKVKKFQKRSAPTEQTQEGTPKANSGTPSPTLNNKQTVSTTSTTLPARTEQERIQRALAALAK